MEYSGRNSASDNGQPIWPGVVPPRLEEIARRGNGLVLALWGGAAVALGAMLPFTADAQITVGGIPSSIAGISGGDRFISFLFGLILAGLALWTRYRPEFSRRIAIASLIVSALGLAGYCLFTLIGLANFTVQTDNVPTQYSWDPSVGALLSMGGCAACAIAAFVMLRTRPPAPRAPW